MPFESLSERYEFVIDNFPEEWLPLTYLYDPDLPLFPLQYFHVLDPSLEVGERPGERDRAFGFVAHHINLAGTTLTVTVALNKDLTKPQHSHFIAPVEIEVRNRLGLGDPIRFSQLQGQLVGRLANANDLVKELWYQVIDRQFGKALPFGGGMFGTASLDWLDSLQVGTLTGDEKRGADTDSLFLICIRRAHSHRQRNSCRLFLVANVP